jgi:hypothetical protein
MTHGTHGMLRVTGPGGLQGRLKIHTEQSPKNYIDVI